MFTRFTVRWGVALGVLIGALIAVISIIPGGSTQAAKDKQKGLFQRNSSVDDDVPRNWDIREAKGSEVAELLEKYRGDNRKDAASVADIRDRFVRGEETFKQRHPHAVVEYNTDIRTPEVIAPDAKRLTFEWLTQRAKGSRPDILRNFIKENTDLVGVNSEQVDALQVTADYTNPAGNISYVHLEQSINGIPVFRGEVKAGFTKSGQIIRVINNLAPALDYSSLSSDFGDASTAVNIAGGHIKHPVDLQATRLNEKASTDLKSIFGEGDWATTAEKMYFPTEPGIAVPVWRVLIWSNPAYYVIVDAKNSAVLWHKNITDDQLQGATYQVYHNPNAFMLAADNPAPLSPGPINPTLGTQGAIIPRTNVTLVGNEAPFTFNNNGWITDGTNITDGNAVEAGVDRVTPNGVDATQTGIPTRVFDSTWNPPPGNPAPGDDPLTAQAQRGAVIQMFYVMNRWHDAMYLLGFNEQSRNFQASNFGRGGSEVDRVSAEGQDNTVGSSCPAQPCVNNANFSTPADGGRGRMQMYLWNGPTPDYDGTADAEVIVHEASHGLSNRLHGNGSGLTSNMSGGMGEGWGDFYGYSMLAEPSDPINGVYTTGGYATFLAAAGYTSNYYHGIRRFPRAPITLLGPNGKPHNPLTFRYLNAGCAALIGTTTSNPPPNSAYPRGPFGVAQCDQVHNAGEVWSSMLWEVRNRMVARLGFQAGTTRALQVVTDGMKLAPLNPTFLQERDAIITAAAALSLAPEAALDVVDVRDGFRVRGMGFSASIQGTSPAAVTEAFDAANASITASFSVSDAAPGGNANGFPEPGELVSMSISVTNITGAPVTNVVVTANGGGNGSANYGTVADGATVVRTISYAIPAQSACGSVITVPLTVTSDIGSQPAVNKSFNLGQPSGGLTENFDAAVPPALPAGWTQVQTSGTGINWTTVNTTPNSAPNAAFANEPTTPNTTALVSPVVNITSTSATVSFRNNFNTESTFDGMVLEIKIGAGAFTDIVTAGGSFTSGGYNSTIAVTDSTITGRQAWSGSSGGYITSTATLPASANGQSVQLRWLAATDTGTTATGVRVDDISIVSGYTCAPVLAAGVEVSGRVLGTLERGLTNARVSLTDDQGVTRTVTTGRLGRFTFEDVEPGHTYVLSVSSRRFTYAPRIVQVTDNISGIEFTPEP